MDNSTRITELTSHFAECRLPVRFVDERPGLRFSQPPTALSIADFFFIDVLHNATPDQTFRLWTHSDAEAQVTAKRANTRHLLLQVRAAPRDPKRIEKTTLLLGHDERQLFVVPTPRVTTVQAAVDSLKPREVVAAERRGLKVVRQGDWFFVPMRANFAPTANMVTYQKTSIGAQTPQRSGNQHIAELQAVNPGQWVEWRGVKRLVGRAVYVMGKIRHNEHATVELAHWHLAVPNQVGDAPRAIGYFD
jgi:hypothetical protein